MRKKKLLIGVLILCLSIGFASIATNLIINNTTSIGKNINDFDVYFSGAILDGVDKSNELINKSNKKEIYFTSNNLKYSDDESILEYEITNNSSNYDASVNIECKYTNEDTSINNRITITENPTSLTIEAKSIGNGNITAKLNEMATEEVEIPIICTLTANAIERNSKEDKALESITYGISGYLVSVEGNPLKDKYLAVYSEEQIVKTDGTGYFFVSNLERGNHTIYYLDEDNTLETSEIKANISTNKSEEIKFNNGIKINEVNIGTNKEIYTLTLNLNYEGSENQERQIIKGQKYNELPTLSRDGYEFLGWYTSESTQDETTKVNSDDTYNVSDNQTLYAGWKPLGVKADEKIISSNEAIELGGGYRYVGANPKNYITFNCDDQPTRTNCETWRIIGVFDGRVKVISDGGTKSNYSQTYRCNSSDRANCTNAYMSSQIKKFVESKVKADALNYIDAVQWNIGSIQSEQMDFGVENYRTVVESASKTSATKIGLMYPSDYGYTYYGLNDYYPSNLSSADYRMRSQTSWLYKGEEWTITPYYGNSYMALYLDSVGRVANIHTVDYYLFARPCAYLSTNTRLCGSGTTDTPYYIC